MWDDDFRCAGGRQRLRNTDTNLGSVALRAERGPVLYTCATLIAGMFHRISRYSRAGEIGKEARI